MTTIEKMNEANLALFEIYCKDPDLAQAISQIIMSCRESLKETEGAQ